MRRYEGDELNHRSLYLRILHRLWLIPAAAVICALVFGVAYTMYMTAFTGQRQYLETSKYYVHYAFNENTQTAYDNYNAYTWDDILYAHPAIRDAIEAGLPDGMTMDEAREDTEALVLSDIRLLTIEVTAATPDKASALSDAIRAGLSSFGEVMEEFESIEFLSADEPTLVVVSDRTNNAVILGVVLGALTAMLWILIRESASDAIYAPEDLTQRFRGLPVLGATAAEGAAVDKVIPAFLTAELRRTLSGDMAECDGRLMVVSPMGHDAAVAAIAELQAVLGEQAAYTMVPCGMADDAAFGEIRPEGLVLVVVPYGVDAAAVRTMALMGQLSQRQARVLGFVLTGCKGAFLRIYYGA